MEQNGEVDKPYKLRFSRTITEIGEALLSPFQADSVGSIPITRLDKERPP
jgi:hypothetical protein